jgi:hypothetical protein
VSQAAKVKVMSPESLPVDGVLVEEAAALEQAEHAALPVEGGAEAVRAPGIA